MKRVFDDGLIGQVWDKPAAPEIIMVYALVTLVVGFVGVVTGRRWRRGFKKGRPGHHTRQKRAAHSTRKRKAAHGRAT
jgi:hypothetical protein